MKPIELKIQGFMTFNKETVIDFSKLGASGLFLITGNTGAGKSTIFDAISYALFGTVSGDLRSNTSPVSDFSKNNEIFFVELKFMHKNKTYIAKRNIDFSKQNPKKTASLFCEDEDLKINSFTSLNNKINEILGIGIKQYKNISMLAQGEFMNLLNAKSNEKGKILREIFDTYIYDVLKTKLNDITDNFKKECEKVDSALIQSLNRIEYDEKDGEYDELKEWLNGDKDINKAENIIEILSEMLNADKETLLNIEKEKLTAEKNYNDAEIELSSAKSDNEIFKRKEKLENERKELENKKPEIIEKEKNLNLILRGKNVNIYYQNYLKEKDLLKKVNSEIEKNKKTLEKLKLNQDNVKTNYENAKTMLPEIESLAAEILKENTALKDYDELENLNIRLKDCNNKKTHINKEYKTIENQISRLNENFDFINENIEKLKDIDVDLINTQNIYESKIVYKNSLSELLKNFKKIKKDEKRINNLESDFLEAEIEYQKISKKYEAARAAFLSGQAGIMAQALKEGDECPVCGSVSHPKKAELIDKIPSEDEINILEKEKNAKDKTSKNKNNALRESRAKIETITDSFISQIKELLNLDDNYCFDESEKILSDNISLINKEIKKLSDNIAVLKDKMENKNNFIKEKTIIEGKIKENKNQFDEIKIKKENIEKIIIEIKTKTETLSEKLKFENKKAAIKNIEEKQNLKNNLQKNIETAEKEFIGLNNKIQKLEAVLNENEKNKEDYKTNIKTANDKYCEKLKENDFVDEYEFFESIKIQQLENDLKNNINDFKNRELKNKTSFDITNKELEGKEFKNIDDLTEKRDILLKAKNDTSDCFLNLNKKCDINSKILNEALELLSSQKASRRKYLNAYELYRTASGSLSGKNKISIENYIQAFYFQRIIQEANKRLTIMTDGQYELYRKESTTNLSKSFALDLMVFDYYTAKARDVRSLSGGETFKAALALALGLSDVIQQEAGGIEIDTIFIDEGFGSLDSDSLEQAISVLYEMSEGNRLVGIISHVNELKERISKKITVTKTLCGSNINIEA